MASGQVPASVQRRVRGRAGDRCEYCRLAQAGQEATFHIDHVVPRREGGPTKLDNLALACVSCSLRKGARTQVDDPATGRQVPIFNPRQERWTEHFALMDDGLLTGLTPQGRGTVQLLRLNRPVAVAIRFEEMTRERYP